MKAWMTGLMTGAVVLAGVAVATIAAAQHVHGGDAQGGVVHSDHRAVNRYLMEFDRVVGEGRGFGLAFAADQQGYPGPMHVLELRDRLGLTAEQEHEMRRLVEMLFAESKPKAAQLLAAEQRLWTLFAIHSANEATVRAALAEVERARTEVRLVHLLIHLKTRDHLTDQQRRLYHAARWGR